jgi:hypothetical protein
LFPARLLHVKLCKARLGATPRGLQMSRTPREETNRTPTEPASRCAISQSASKPVASIDSQKRCGSQFGKSTCSLAPPSEMSRTTQADGLRPRAFIVACRTTWRRPNERRSFAGTANLACERTVPLPERLCGSRQRLNGFFPADDNCMRRLDFASIPHTSTIRKPSPQRVMRPVEGEGKWAIHIRVGVSHTRENSSRRETPACLES